MLKTGQLETGLRINVVMLGVVVLGVVGLDVDGLAAPAVTYNRSTGAVSVDTSDGTLLFSIVVTGPEATSIDRWQDGSFEDEKRVIELKSNFLNRYVYSAILILILLLVAIFYFVSR